MKHELMHCLRILIANMITANIEGNIPNRFFLLRCVDSLDFVPKNRVVSKYVIICFKLRCVQKTIKEAKVFLV